MTENFKPTRFLFRSACPMCELMLSALSQEELSQAHVDHLTKHLEDYCEEECEAGRMERVVRDGKTLYREVAHDPS